MSQDNNTSTSTATAVKTETSQLTKMQTVIISLIDTQRNWFSTRDSDGNLLPPDSFRDEYVTFGLKKNTVYKNKSGQLYSSDELAEKALDAHRDQRQFMYLEGVPAKRSSSGNKVRIISFSPDQGLIGVFDGARKVSFNANQISSEAFGGSPKAENSGDSKVSANLDTSKLFD